MRDRPKYYSCSALDKLSEFVSSSSKCLQPIWIDTGYETIRKMCGVTAAWNENKLNEKFINGFSAQKDLRVCSVTLYKSHTQEIPRLSDSYPITPTFPPRMADLLQFYIGKNKNFEETMESQETRTLRKTCGLRCSGLAFSLTIFTTCFK